jgi:O-antigen ligase
MLFIVHMLLTCLALALPRSERQLQWLYAVCCLVVLGLSYIGVALLPNLSIHQAYDAVEADLAGNWRGVFEHKNAAGCVMVVFVFMGLYIARSYNAAIGWLIAAASVVFLIFSHSKTSIALLPVVLVVAYFFERCRSTSARALTGLSLLVAINFAAIGASFPGPVRQALQYAMPDVSFTGRTHLWAFAITNIAEHPILGHGSGAFWRTGSTMYKDREAAEPEDISGWAAELGTDSHNGYIETALSTGIPGLLLILFWLVLTPLLDYPRAVGSPSNRPLATLYVRIWLYSLYLGSLETIPSVQNPAWFLMLQAMFGLALLARMRVR